MRKPVNSTLLFLGIFLCAITLANIAAAEIPSSIEEYVERLKSEGAEADFEGFADALLPTESYDSDLREKFYGILKAVFANKPVETDILLRDVSGGNNEKSVIALYSGYDYFYISVVYHKRPEGVVPIVIKGNTSLGEVLSEY